MQECLFTLGKCEQRPTSLTGLCQTPVTILTYLSPPLYLQVGQKLSNSKQVPPLHFTHTTDNVHTHAHSLYPPHCVHTRMYQLLSVYTLERDSRNTQQLSAISLLSTYPQTEMFPGPFPLPCLPASPLVCLRLWAGLELQTGNLRVALVIQASPCLIPHKQTPKHPPPFIFSPQLGFAASAPIGWPAAQSPHLFRGIGSGLSSFLYC